MTTQEFFDEAHEQLDVWQRRLDDAERSLRKAKAEQRRVLREQLRLLSRRKRELDGRLQRARVEAGAGASELRDDLERGLRDFRRNAGRVLDAVKS